LRIVTEKWFSWCAATPNEAPRCSRQTASVGHDSVCGGRSYGNRRWLWSLSSEPDFGRVSVHEVLEAVRVAVSVPTNGASSCTNAFEVIAAVAARRDWLSIGLLHRVESAAAPAAWGPSSNPGTTPAGAAWRSTLQARLDDLEVGLAPLQAEKTEGLSD
jgi:hypothetical protein